MLFAGVCCLWTAVGAGAQPEPVPPPVAATSDPNEFIRAAAVATSLTEHDMKPWHLRARYQQFAADGTVKREGTIEMWWAAPDRFKAAYASPDFTRTEYLSGKDIYYTGQAEWPSSLEDEVRNLLLHPLPEEADLGDYTFTEKDQTFGSTAFKCYFQLPKSPGMVREVVTNAKGEQTMISPVIRDYCFLGAAPVVRIMQDVHPREGTVETGIAFNGIVLLAHHYVAKNVRWTTHGKPWINIDVEQVDPALTVVDADLAPPADARIAPPRKVTVSAGVMQGDIIKSTPPAYPDYARTNHITGTVVLEGTIDKQGNVANLKVISGPIALQHASLDAVQQWRYRPYLLNGEPVEVQTQINVIFNIETSTSPFGR